MEDDAEPRTQEPHEDRPIWGFVLPLSLHAGGAAQEAEGPIFRRSQREDKRLPARYQN